MARLDDFDFFQWQAVAVLDDNNSAANPSPKNLLKRQRHARRGFAASRNKNTAKLVEIVTTLANLQAMVMQLNMPCDRCEGIGGLQSRRENFARVAAQPTYWKHLSSLTISEEKPPTAIANSAPGGSQATYNVKR
jgi:hypothetical protein